MTRTLRYSAFALVVALVLGGCGSSATKPNPASDLALAKSAALTGADLPSFFARPYAPSSDTPVSVKQQFAKCLKVSTTVFDDTPGAQEAHSPDFTKNSSSVSNSVEIDPRQSDIDQDWTELAGPTVAHCLERLFQATVKLAAPVGVTFGATTVTKFSVGIGSRSVGYTAKLSATSNRLAMSFYLDFLFVARDRAGIDLDAFNAGQPFDRATEIALARKVYNRIGTQAA